MAEENNKEKQFREAMEAAGFDSSSSVKPSFTGAGVTGSLHKANSAEVIGASGYTPGSFKTPDPVKDRVGDYVQDNSGNWTVVKNSPTDIAQRFLTTGAVSSKQGLSLTDFFNAGKTAGLAALGMPTNYDSIGATIGTGVISQAATSNPFARGIWAVLNGAQSLTDAEQRRVDEYLSQDFNYDIAVKLTTDQDGTQHFTPDYKKMAETGNTTESGESVRDLTDTSGTGANMLGDNKLNINVSPVFAQSSAYNELLKTIKDTYSSMTESQANEVIDNDTGATRLDTLSNLVKSAESNFYYNLQTVRDIKTKAPTASDKSLNMAVETSKIGYLNKKTLEDIEVNVYDDTNKLIKVNAKEYLDSISNMTKIERNDYMSRLSSRISDNNISDDEKAVLYAQSQALYAASDTEGDYQGMYQRQWYDEIGSTSDPIFGLSFNTYFGGTDLDTFRQNELAAGLLDIGTTFASVKALTGVTNLIEKGARSVTPGLSKTVGGSLTEAAESSKLIEKVGSKYVADKVTAGNIGKTLLKSGAQVGYQLAADAAYDAAKAIPYAITGNEYDFADELKTDFMMDMLVTYGPRQFAQSMGATKMEYGVAVENKDKIDLLSKITNKKGATRENIIGDLKENFKSATKNVDLEKMSDDELKDFMSSLATEYKSTRDVKDRPDLYTIKEDETGTRDVKLVEVTGETLSKRRAATLAKLEDTKIVEKMQKTFFDKNVAMGKLALQVRAVSDDYHYKKFLRQVNAPIRQATRDVKDEWMTKAGVKDAMDDLSAKLKDAGVRGGFFRPRGLSREDNNYIKAKTNEARFLGKNEASDEKKSVKEQRAKSIVNFYQDGKKGVSKERAKQLDALIKAMQNASAKIVDFYVEKGLMSKEDAEELRSSPGYEDGFIPMYAVPGSKLEGEIGQDRALFKRVKNENVLIPLNELDNPLESMARYINNAMRAVAVNDRALAIREAASMTGVGIRVASDEGDVLKDFKSLKSTDASFRKIYNGIAKKVKESFPTLEQWQENNDKMILRSHAMKEAQKLSDLQKQEKDLRKGLRKAQYNLKKMPKENPFVLYRGQGDSEKLAYNNMQSSPVYGNGYFFNTKKFASKKYGAENIALGFKKDEVLSAKEFRQLNKMANEKVSDSKYMEKMYADDPNRAELIEQMAIGNLPAFARYTGKPVVETTGGIADAKNYVYYDDVDQSVSNRVKAQLERKTTDLRAGYQKDIDDYKSQLVDVKAQQLFAIDNIKKYTGNLMQRAMKAHKGDDLKFDEKLYLNVQVTNGLKDAFKSENMVGKIQKILNKAVAKANPWVDPETIIRRRAEAAAVEYRKKVVKNIEEQQKQKAEGKRLTQEKINAVADKVMDKITQRINGERQSEVTIIDDDGMPRTEILTNYDQPNVIRYKLDGKEYRMTLVGKGAEELVSEFYAPEFVAPKTTTGHIMRGINNLAKKLGQAKRYLTTSADITRALPNIMRDWTRGVVSTGGKILLSPEQFFSDLVRVYGYSAKQVEIIQNGLDLAKMSLKDSTLTASLEMPRKNRENEMVRALTEKDGNAFERWKADVTHGQIGRSLSAVQDAAETFTRTRAMETAYYKTLADDQAKGKTVEESIKHATEDAYFAGREATVNFFRRGQLVEKVAQYVPYLSQRFATLESFKYAYVNDPIGVTRALRSTLSAYTTLIAIALSNEESREKYYLLSEYDRANNVIIPIDNRAIITIPLDDTIAAFLTPYRRVVEFLNGSDPEAFYLCFAEGLEALSPLDLSGFSEGDGFNVARGFEKVLSGVIPTWAMPFVEIATGKDWYYGSQISVDETYTGITNDNWTPTPGELTTKGKNSQTLASISNNTGIPQWMLQEFLSEYGGNVGQYVLNMVDKVGGATEAAQGGKEWIDSVFKPFTGSDSNQAKNDFYTLVNTLKGEKQKVQNEIKTLTSKINGAGANEKADLIKQRQKKIREYGIHVSDALNSYLSAYNITGGLSKKLANQVWYLYKIYDEDSNRDLYIENSTGDYFTDKAAAWNNKQAVNLAAQSGLDSYVTSPVNDFYDTYAEQAFKNTSYGDAYNYIAEIEDVFNDNKINRSKMFENYTKMNSAQKKQWKAAWNTKVVKALAPYVKEVGVDNLLSQRKVVDYLDEVIFVSNPWKTKDYLKQIFGGK